MILWKQSHTQGERSVYSVSMTDLTLNQTLCIVIFCTLPCTIVREGTILEHTSSSIFCLEASDRYETKVEKQY
jgi:hypothetical protein